MLEVYRAIAFVSQLSMRHILCRMGIDAAVCAAVCKGQLHLTGAAATLHAWRQGGLCDKQLACELTSFLHGQKLAKRIPARAWLPACAKQLRWQAIHQCQRGIVT